MHELACVTDDALASALPRLTARDCLTTAWLLAYLGELDARRLYLPLGYPSLHVYCQEALRFSRSGAYQRVCAARAARRFPRLLTLVAEGKLDLAALGLLAPRLTDENFAELAGAATYRTKAEVARWLAVRFTAPVAPGAAATEGELFPAPATDPQYGVEPSGLLELVLYEPLHGKVVAAEALLREKDMEQILELAFDGLIAKVEKANERRRRARRRGPIRPAEAAPSDAPVDVTQPARGRARAVARHYH